MSTNQKVAGVRVLPSTPQKFLLLGSSCLLELHIYLLFCPSFILRTCSSMQVLRFLFVDEATIPGRDIRQAACTLPKTAEEDTASKISAPKRTTQSLKTLEYTP